MTRRESDVRGFGAYPNPSLRPVTLNGRTSFRCPSCSTNGSGSHVPGSDICREFERERRWSRSS